MKKLTSTLTVIVALGLMSSIARAQSDKRFEVGGQFAFIRLTDVDIARPGFGGRIAGGQPGFGPRLAWNLTSSASLEAEANFFRKDELGGKKTQSFLGLKYGKRSSTVGIFGKVRPGFMQFNHIFVTDRDPGALTNTRFERKTYLAVDLGGVIEFYPSSRTLIRFDVSDVIVRYGERFTNLPSDINGTGIVPPDTRHNLQFSVGVGFRF